MQTAFGDCSIGIGAYVLVGEAANSSPFVLGQKRMELLPIRPYTP
jgi:hypothetical protein